MTRSGLVTTVGAAYAALAHSYPNAIVPVEPFVAPPGPAYAAFDFSGPLAEAVLLGTVALRFPKTTLHWNAAALTFTEAEANHFIRRSYRSGWGVKGL